MSSAEQLTLTLLSSRSGATPWSQDSWLLGVPQWAEDPQVAGALARLPVPTRRLSEATVEQRARGVLDTLGDRGWGELLVLLEHPHACRQLNTGWRTGARPGHPHLCVGLRSA